MSNHNSRSLGPFAADRPAPPPEIMRLGALLIAIAVAISVIGYNYASSQAGDSMTAAGAGAAIGSTAPTATTIPTATATVMAAPEGAEAGTPAAATAVPPTERVHIVEGGDTLAKIAGRYGVPLSDLIAANPQIAHPSLIEVGQRIRIPD